jgi:hypothetical protein
MIKVIDPRHALYGQTFPLIETSTKQYVGRCCVVSYRPALVRYIPLAATDRSPEPLVIAPFPLNLKAVQQLLTSYEKIVAQLGEGTADEITNRGAGKRSPRSAGQATRLSPGSGANAASANLAPAESGATGTRFSTAGVDLPAGAQRSRPDGAGGER